METGPISSLSVHPLQRSTSETRDKSVKKGGREEWKEGARENNESPSIVAGNKIKRILKLARANFLAFPRIIRHPPFPPSSTFPLYPSFSSQFFPSYRAAKPSIERTPPEYSARTGIGENALSLRDRRDKDDAIERDRERDERVKGGGRMSKSNSRLDE